MLVKHYVEIKICSGLPLSNQWNIQCAIDDSVMVIVSLKRKKKNFY